MNAARVLQMLVVAVAVVVTAGAAWAGFVWYPSSLQELAGLVVAVVLVATVLQLAARAASSIAPAHNVAVVSVDGPITRDGAGSAIASTPTTAGADEIVEQIERADEGRGADALVVELNTPGGQIVPSEDIRRAAESFDGPTVAHAVDICASGGYDIASGCDEIWAREGALIGSIGVVGSRVTAADLRDKLGLTYEQLTAGEFKDAGVPLREMDDDDRAYLQGIIDDYYDRFVETVADRRPLSADEVRDTEAKIFLGSAAAERDLVDELGTRDDVEDHLAEELGEPVTVREFEPDRGLARRLRGGAMGLAYAVGAGLASPLAADADGLRVRE